MWMAERERLLPMSYEEVKAEYDAKLAERTAKVKAEAEAETDALGTETEVHDGDAPYAIATDGSLQPAAGVSDENIDAGSTPLAGKPADAKPSIMPSDAPDAAALTPVVETPVAPDDASAATEGAPAVSEAPAQSPDTPPSDAPAGDAPANAPLAADAPVGTPVAGDAAAL